METCPNGKHLSAQQMKDVAAAFEHAAMQQSLSDEESARALNSRADAAGAQARARVLAQGGQQCPAFVPRQPTPAQEPTPAFASTVKKYPWWQWVLAVGLGVILAGLLVWGLASVSKGGAPLVGAPAPTVSAPCAPTCAVPQIPVVVNVYAGNSPQVTTSRGKKVASTPADGSGWGCLWESDGHAILKGQTSEIPQGVELGRISEKELLALYPFAADSHGAHRRACKAWVQGEAQKKQTLKGLRVN